MRIDSEGRDVTNMPGLHDESDVVLYEPIESAPKDGTIVELASQEHPGMLPQAMAWDGVRWSGMVFMPLGSKETWWDESDPPTHWRPVK
jgi:hypothetical protein